MDGGSTAISLSLSLEELEAQITELAGQLNAANYRWLLLIAEFDRRKGWGDGKLPSCAHWLNFKCGLNLGAAREKVRVAHALGELPKISASMARGELSYSKVRALTRVACPATEDNDIDDHRPDDVAAATSVSAYEPIIQREDDGRWWVPGYGT